MDGTRFDDLARSLARVRSRRGLLRGLGLLLGAGAVGAITLDDSDAAATCRPGGAICSPQVACCSGTCQPTDAYGRRRCACEANTTPCGASTCCPMGEVCVSGACRQPTPAATRTVTLTTTATPTPDLARDCAPDADICTQEAGYLCAGDHCSCLQRIGGAGVLCGEGGACQACAADADCGPGRYCVIAAAARCCDGATATACYSPCAV